MTTIALEVSCVREMAHNFPLGIQPNANLGADGSRVPFIPGTSGIYPDNSPQEARRRAVVERHKGDACLRRAYAKDCEYQEDPVMLDAFDDPNEVVLKFGNYCYAPNTVGQLARTGTSNRVWVHEGDHPVLTDPMTRAPLGVCGAPKLHPFVYAANLAPPRNWCESYLSWANVPPAHSPWGSSPYPRYRTLIDATRDAGVDSRDFWLLINFVREIKTAHDAAEDPTQNADVRAMAEIIRDSPRLKNLAALFRNRHVNRVKSFYGIDAPALPVCSGRGRAKAPLRRKKPRKRKRKKPKKARKSSKRRKSSKSSRKRRKTGTSSRKRRKSSSDRRRKTRKSSRKRKKSSSSKRRKSSSSKRRKSSSSKRRKSSSSKRRKSSSSKRRKSSSSKRRKSSSSKRRKSSSSKRRKSSSSKRRKSSSSKRRKSSSSKRRKSSSSKRRKTRKSSVKRRKSSSSRPSKPRKSSRKSRRASSRKAR